jgi:hypothetical protein
MRRTRASAAAGAVNLKQRCGQCKTCMNNLAGGGRAVALMQMGGVLDRQRPGLAGLWGRPS